MTFSSRWLLVPFLGALVGADKPSSAPSDVDRLQGTWKVVSGEFRGKPAPEDAVKNVTWIVQGKQITSQGGKGKSFEITFRLDPTKKPPAIDLTNPERKQTIQGIYKLAGDTLTLCLGAAPGESRPKAFATGEKVKAVILVMKKEKKSGP